MEFQVSIFIYSYLCDQRDHQRDLTRLSRNPPEKKRKVTLKRPPLSLNPSLIENIFCRKIEAKGRIISACLLTIVSGAITSQVSQKMRHNFLLTQIVANFDANCYNSTFCDSLSRRLPCWTVLPGNSLVEIRLSVAFIYFFY